MKTRIKLSEMIFNVSVDSLLFNEKILLLFCKSLNLIMYLIQFVDNEWHNLIRYFAFWCAKCYGIETWQKKILQSFISYYQCHKYNVNGY